MIPEEFETSIEIFARVLNRFGISRSIIEQQIAKIREQGYEILRSSAPAASLMNAPIIDLNGASTETIVLDAGSPVIGRNLGELDLRKQSGATVIAIVTGGDTKISPGAGHKLSQGDTIVLLGSTEEIDRAMSIIRPGESVGGFNP